MTDTSKFRQTAALRHAAGSPSLRLLRRLRHDCEASVDSAGLGIFAIASRMINNALKHDGLGVGYTSDPIRSPRTPDHDDGVNQVARRNISEQCR